MAKKVTVAVLGGDTMTYDNFETIGQIKSELGLQKHVAKLNGESANDDDTLDDYSYVTLAPAVKGGSVG